VTEPPLSLLSPHIAAQQTSSAQQWREEKEQRLATGRRTKHIKRQEYDETEEHIVQPHTRQSGGSGHEAKWRQRSAEELNRQGSHHRQQQEQREGVPKGIGQPTSQREADGPRRRAKKGKEHDGRRRKPGYKESGRERGIDEREEDAHEGRRIWQEEVGERERVEVGTLRLAVGEAARRERESVAERMRERCRRQRRDRQAEERAVALKRTQDAHLRQVALLVPCLLLLLFLRHVLSTVT
jgi:hypothetical protein